MKYLFKQWKLIDELYYFELNNIRAWLKSQAPTIHSGKAKQTLKRINIPIKPIIQK